jgi:hypothetical protein
MNLLHAHGSPTNYRYVMPTYACRCPWCKAGNVEYLGRWHKAHPGRRTPKKPLTEEQRERYRETDKRRRERNREHIRAYNREYYATHPERRAALRVYHTRRRSGSRERGTHFTRDDILNQMERQKGRCFWCRKKIKGNYHADHVTPLSIEINNRPENIVISCISCNLRKKNKHPMDWAGVMF